MEFGLNARSNVVNVEPEVARLTLMNDRTPTNVEHSTKLGQRIPNGSHSSCVGMDQDGLGVVKQASIGASAMDHGMESNDGQVMDQEWNQAFAMVEQVEVSDFVVKPSLKFNYALRGSECKNSPPNHTNQSETVRNCGSALHPRPSKVNTKLY